MTTPELTKWLRKNSSGDYRPAAEAADLIDRLVKLMREVVVCSDAMKIAASHPAMTRDASAAWKVCGEELESAISTAMPDYDRVCRDLIIPANAEVKRGA